MKEIKTLRVFTSVLCVAAAAPGGAVAQPAPFLGFADPILIEAGVASVHVKVMDLDGANGMDLVVANRGVYNVANSPPSIQTFISDGMGGYTLGQQFNFPLVTEPRHLATGDLNGDGLMDLVVADGRGNRILSLIRRSSGGFDLPQPFPVGHAVMSVDLGQINGGVDNFLDVVTGNYTFQTNYHEVLGSFFGLNNGAFSPVSLFNFDVNRGPSDRTVFAAMADSDGDGVLDKVVSVQNPLGAGQSTTAGDVTLTDIDLLDGSFAGLGSTVFAADLRRSPVRPTAIHVDSLDGDLFSNDLIIPANSSVSENAYPLSKGVFVALDGATPSSFLTSRPLSNS